jgi:hypothetical protein
MSVLGAVNVIDTAEYNDFLEYHELTDSIKTKAILNSRRCWERMVSNEMTHLPRRRDSWIL